MDWSKVLFDPNGRIGQQPFWIGVLIIVAGNLVLPAIPIIGWIAWIALIWVGIAVYGKRLHDAGKTAWLHAIPWALNIILTIIGLAIFGVSLIQLILDAAQNDEPSTQSIIGIITASGGLLLMVLLGTLVWIGYTIWVGMLKAEPGANQYGPAPVLEGEARESSSASTGDAPDGGH
ncbi:MAG: DUF805 domain-containing protein [Oceanicaulis sp.]